MTVELKDARHIRLSDEVFTIPAPLVLEITSHAYKVQGLYVVVKNGSKKQAYNYSKPIDLSAFAFPGRLDVEISMVRDGKTLRAWTCEPLYLRECPEGFEGAPEVEALKEEIAVLKKAVSELAGIVFDEI